MIRPIFEYIDQLIALAPSEQGRLLAGLKSARQSALYTPPEYWHEVRQCVQTLVSLYAAGDEPWAQQIRAAVAEDLATWNQIHQRRGGEALTSEGSAADREASCH
jgi:uncharacterized protein YbaP (TraB family)